MALTATVTLSLATSQINQPTAVGILVSNGGGSAVTLTSVTPTISASGAPAASPTAGIIGQTPLGPNTTTTIGASGSLLLSTEAFGQAPATYAIGAYVVDTSGTVTVATPVTYISTPPPLPASEL